MQDQRFSRFIAWDGLMAEALEILQEISGRASHHRAPSRHHCPTRGHELIDEVAAGAKGIVMHFAQAPA